MGFKAFQTTQNTKAKACAEQTTSLMPRWNRLATANRFGDRTVDSAEKMLVERTSEHVTTIKTITILLITWTMACADGQVEEDGLQLVQTERPGRSSCQRSKRDQTAL